VTDDANGDAASPDQDLGEPIAELAALQEAVPERFAQRIIGAVRRRQLTSEFVGLWWTGLGRALLEFIGLAMGLIGIGEQADGSE
jgi:hypothetical protein